MVKSSIAMMMMNSMVMMMMMMMYRSWKFEKQSAALNLTIFASKFDNFYIKS